MHYTPHSWNIDPIDFKLGTKVYINKKFLKMSKRICSFSKFCWRQHFLQCETIFQKIKTFQNVCSNWTKKLFLDVYNDKPNVFQVLECNYFDSSCLYSQKGLILKDRLVTFVFSVALREKDGCDRPHPDMIF